MELKGYLARLRGRIEAETDREVARWFAALPSGQRQAVREIVASGKRIRAALACLVAQALGASCAQAMPAAVAVEMVQAASLVHDDFVDGDLVRRGRPAAWTVLAPRRAVLVADVMFATAIENMAALGQREAMIIAGAIAEMGRGALQEALAGSGMKGVDARQAYRHLIRLKTGSLFSAAARLGALAAAAGPAAIEAAARYGGHAGAAFQIADDLEDGDTADDLQPVMQAEMHDAIARSRAALATFPDNAYTALLYEMPAHFLAQTIAEP